MQVNLARIVGVHGIKGLVKVRSFTQNPTDLFQYNPLDDKDGKAYTLHLERFLPNGIMLCRLDGCSNRNDAENHRGTDLFVSRDRMPKLEEDTYYYSDLEGLNVIDTKGHLLGRVKAVNDHGAGVFLDVIKTDQPKMIATLPFNKEVVVDLEGKQLIIDPSWLIEPSPRKGDHHGPDHLS